MPEKLRIDENPIKTKKKTRFDQKEENFKTYSVTNWSVIKTSVMLKTGLFLLKH